MKYYALGERYIHGKRWLMVAKALSWYSFLLLPCDGTRNVQYRDIYKLPNEAFDLLLTQLTKHKKEFVLKICGGLEQAIRIDSVSNFTFHKRIRLESTSINMITSYSEISDSLPILAQVI